jgi:hypothetical protein
LSRIATGNDAAGQYLQKQIEAGHRMVSCLFIICLFFFYLFILWARHGFAALGRAC